MSWWLCVGQQHHRGFEPQGSQSKQLFIHSISVCSYQLSLEPSTGVSITAAAAVSAADSPPGLPPSPPQATQALTLPSQWLSSTPRCCMPTTAARPSPRHHQQQALSAACAGWDQSWLRTDPLKLFQRMLNRKFFTSCCS